MSDQTTDLHARLATARWVAEHWRAAAMGWDPPAPMIAHPLSMVLAALDGVTDPAHLGIEEDAHTDLHHARQAAGKGGEHR